MIKQPFKQGILDGMCGFYSIINAIYYIKPTMTTVKAERLLRNMVKTRPNSFHKMFLDGTYLENIVDLLKHVINYEHGYGDINFSLPFEYDNFDDAYEYLACLNEHVDGVNRVAILSIGAPWNHWTVAVKIDLKKERLHLFDSYYGSKKENVLEFKDLSLKKNCDMYHLFPEDTIIISKK